MAWGEGRRGRGGGAGQGMGRGRVACLRRGVGRVSGGGPHKAVRVPSWGAVVPTRGGGLMLADVRELTWGDCWMLAEYNEPL